MKEVYSIVKKKGDQEELVRIISLAGKVRGRNDGCYNVCNLKNGNLEWVDFRQLASFKKKENNENEESSEDEVESRGEEEVFSENEEFERYSTEEGETEEVNNEEAYYCKMFGKEYNKEIKEAKLRELNSWEINDVYQEVREEDIKEGSVIVDTRWIIGKKLKEGKEVWKARLVARGFKEKEDLEKEAPTCSSESLKIVLSYINRKGWDVRTIDIKTAYLQGRRINREAFIRPPREAGSNKIWKLNKSVYGLKDAARVWYESLRDILVSTGAEVSNLDQTIFLWKDEFGTYGIMVIHVDDICFGGTDRFRIKLMKLLKDKLKIGEEQKNEFKYIGIDVRKNLDVIRMSQEEYVREKMEEDKRETSLSQREYRVQIGKINWVSQHTRPDVSLEVSKCSRKLGKAAVNDMKRVNEVMRYLKLEKGGIKLERLIGKVNVEIFTDASFGREEGEKSQLGFIVTLVDESGNRCPLIWKSMVSKRVTPSTLSAEVKAAREGVEWGMYVRELWKEITGEEVEESVLYCDNKSMVDAIKSPRSIKCRFLRMELAYLKERKEQNELNRIEWVCSANQVADGLTKEKVSKRKLLRYVDRE